jgi:pSer/pThr/pTyr-binding forkhead associated (FHA) protein
MEINFQGFDTVRSVGCLAFNLLGSEKTVTLEGSRVVFGRAKQNTININEMSVSKIHAVIYCIGGKFFIKDCYSSNGI